MGILPARGGSKGIPRKNIRQLVGRPMIAYSIEAAKKSELIDKFVVSTEDKEIAEMSVLYGAEVLDRPEELAQDTSTTISVLKHAIEIVESEGEKYDIVVLLEPTSPMRKSYHVDEALRKMVDEEGDMVLGVVESDESAEWLMGIFEGKLEFVNRNSLKNARRQDQGKNYFPNAAVYGYNRDVVMKSESYVWGKKVIPYVMDRYDSIEIDSIKDFNIVERLIE